MFIDLIDSTALAELARASILAEDYAVRSGQISVSVYRH
jgi:hypothetical protein